MEVKKSFLVVLHKLDLCHCIMCDAKFEWDEGFWCGGKHNILLVSMCFVVLSFKEFPRRVFTVFCLAFWYNPVCGILYQIYEITMNKTDVKSRGRGISLYLCLCYLCCYDNYYSEWAVWISVSLIYYFKHWWSKVIFDYCYYYNFLRYL